MRSMALVVGSETGGLSGVDSDVDLLSDRLRRRHFDVRALTGAQASRSGILAAYEALIADCQAGDTAVVYYSGHGSRRVTPESTVQFIVPTDMDQSTEDDFRGILAEELSLLQWRLTQRTANVTTILDCCHAARMSRDASLLPKARPCAWPTAGLLARRQAVLEHPAAAAMQGESNPLAVRLVACGPEQVAYETESRAFGGRHGLLTEALVLVLDGLVDDRVTWAGMLPPIAGRVGSIQRPQLEGPAWLVFSLEERESTGVFPLTVGAGGAAWIEAPRLLGPEVGDVYHVCRSGSPTADAIGTATVIDVAAERAEVRLDLFPGRTLSPDLQARPLRVSLGRRAVAVSPAGHPARPAIVDAIARTSHLRVAEDVDRPLARIQLDGDVLLLLDAAGEPLSGPQAIVAANIERVIGDTVLLARAAQLRELEPGEHERLDADVRLTWERVTGGSVAPLNAAGEQLFENDHVQLHVRNASNRDVWVSVLDVGLRGAITLLTQATTSGVPLTPGEVLRVHLSPAGEARTIRMTWPDGLPRGVARPESIVAIVTDRPVDVRALAQPGLVERSAHGQGSLQRLLEAVASGVRDAAPPEEEVVLYRVERLEFLLYPTAAPDLSEPSFGLDERPNVSLRLMPPQSPVVPPRDVAVRLRHLLVRPNRALPSANIRVDTLAVTRSRPGADGPVALAQTDHFPGTGAGNRLPFEALGVYHGPVHDFLDLAIWVSHADQSKATLSDMLAVEAGSTEVKAALAVLADPALQAGAEVRAVAAVAVLVRTAARLINAAADKSVGVYRTSLLPYERFGIGLHPATGLLDAQDMALAYEVVDLDGLSPPAER